MIRPVILSGGAGSRLWPLSTPDHPKQFLPLVGEETLIQQTAARFSGETFLPPAVICNAAHADTVAKQLPDADAVFLEPVGRNTAPAAALATLYGHSTGAELVLLAPADHFIADPDAFGRAVSAAAPVAADGHIVTFGIQPTRAETGYGYIHMGEAIHGDVRRVSAFVEKPDAATARAYLESGDHAWNAGLFLFRPDTMLSELKSHAPDILAAVEDAFANRREEGRLHHLDAGAFAACRSQSLDYAVMEPTTRAACLPVSMGWTDIGSFEALHAARPGNASGNALAEGTRAVGASDCLVDTDGPRVNLVGVSGLAVIVRDGEVLVLDMAHSQSVKRLADAG